MCQTQIFQETLELGEVSAILNPTAVFRRRLACFLLLLDGGQMMNIAGMLALVKKPRQELNRTRPAPFFDRRQRRIL